MQSHGLTVAVLVLLFDVELTGAVLGCTESFSKARGAVATNREVEREAPEAKVPAYVRDVLAPAAAELDSSDPSADGNGPGSHGMAGFCGLPGQSCPDGTNGKRDTNDKQLPSFIVVPKFVEKHDTGSTLSAHGTAGFCGMPGQSCGIPAGDDEPDMGATPSITSTATIVNALERKTSASTAKLGTLGFCGPPGVDCQNGGAATTGRVAARTLLKVASGSTVPWAPATLQTYGQLPEIYSSPKTGFRTTTTSSSASQPAPMTLEPNKKEPTTLLTTASPSPDSRLSQTRNISSCSECPPLPTATRNPYGSAVSQTVAILGDIILALSFAAIAILSMVAAALWLPDDCCGLQKGDV